MKSQVLTVSMLLLTFLGGCDYFRSASARIQRAEDLMATQQYRAASIELKNALEQEPNNPQAHLLFADILLHLSEPDAAAQELRKARANNANVADSNELDMRIKLALGRYDEVIAALTNASDPTPEPQRSLHLAAAYLGLRRYDDALGLFERVKSQQVDTQVGKLEAQLGSIEARTALGQSEQALAELKSITAAHPEAAAAWSLQASLLLRAS
ncbi:MAG: tetratricopeptide repeat protein, partial [Candidatus Obscuribacterales bacterium]|nr:tetratricopeptide repeat protein [Steroidobacteraceae bacterium]